MARNPLARRTQMFEVTIEAHEVRAGPKRMSASEHSESRRSQRSEREAQCDPLRAPWRGRAPVEALHS